MVSGSSRAGSRSEREGRRSPRPPGFRRAHSRGWARRPALLLGPGEGLAVSPSPLPVGSVTERKLRGFLAARFLLVDRDGMRARQLLLPLIIAFTGCSGSHAPEEEGSSQVTELSFLTSFSSGYSELYVFIADDTSAGETLRSAVADAVASYDARLAVEDDWCTAPFDPAALHPVRRDAWVVHPSQSGDQRVSGYPAEPALRWHSTERTDDGAARWARRSRAAATRSTAGTASPASA